MQSDQINELATALAKAQGSMKAAAYNRINPHFKSRYADLAAVWEAIRAPLSSNGLSIVQTQEPINGIGFYLRTTLYHTSGQWISSMYPLPEQAPPQQLGSALTYARRYSLSSIVGIASDEDDDANTAQKSPTSRNVMQAAQQKGAGAEMAQKPLAQDLKDEIPDFADAVAPSVEGAAAVAPSPATGGADLKQTLTNSAVLEAALAAVKAGRAATDVALQLAGTHGEVLVQEFFKKLSKDQKEELRKIKPQLMDLYPK